ncbi:MAG: KTSC domain-containing protein [Cetobacterium sp.]
MIEIKVVDSENIKSIFYFSEKEELWVMFNNLGLYKYEKVTLKTVDKLRVAENVGEYFYHNIRTKFKYSKI